MGDCISWCNPVFKRVEALPDLDYATRNHAYIMPDNKAYILNENGDGFTELTSTATTGGTSYDDKPLVARVEKLEAKEDSDKQTLSLNDRTITISNGNSIELPEETLDGGNNLVCNSAFPENTTGWGLWESPSSQENINLSVNKHSFYYNNTQNLFVLKAPTNDGVPASTKRFPVKRNTTYSINVILFGTGNIKKVNIYFLGRNQGETVTYSNAVNVKEFTGSPSTIKAIRYHFTFNTGESDEGFIRIDNGGKTDSSQTSDLYFTELDVYEGTSPRTWEVSTNCLKERVALLENKPDNDKQKLSYSNGVLSIENGNSVTVPMSIGKSAYQSWLDTGNTGTEQDFIRSLKGAKGDKGDVTDIGTNALLIYYCDLTSNIVHITGGYNAYKALTYNTKTQLGTVHLDLTPTENSPEAHIIGKLPKDAPKPYSLVEVSVFGNNSDGTGQIYITPEGIIRCNALTKGRRYIVDLLGYYVYK